MAFLEATLLTMLRGAGTGAAIVICGSVLALVKCTQLSLSRDAETEAADVIDSNMGAFF